MLRQAWTLFRRELAASRIGFFTVAGLIVLLNLVLWTQLGRSDEMTKVTLQNLSLGFLFIVPLWVVIASLQSWGREWAGRSVHYTLAFPVPGWVLVTAKATAAVVETAVIGALAAASGWPLYSRLIYGYGDPAQMMFWRHALSVVSGLKFAAIGAVYLFVASAIVQLAYLTARTARASRPAAGLVAPVTGITAIWLLLRVSGPINQALSRLPPVTFYIVRSIGKVYYPAEQYFAVAPVIAAAGIGLAYFAVTAWLAERGVDI